MLKIIISLDKNWNGENLWLVQSTLSVEKLDKGRIMFFKLSNHQNKWKIAK